MGSPWSVYEDRVQGWLQPELSFIRRRIESGKPVLGICFGAQAMSAALGGSVRHADRPEYGWTSISSSTQEISDGPWFQFHHDQFTLPPGAVELARNESGVQAFRTGRSLATQFHPEMSGELLASWCVIPDGARELVQAGHDPEKMIEESRAKAIESQGALERMLDWFLDDVVGAIQAADSAG
jgi:GMP synthase-like glutamine amidotransferase